ncbi:MULTISPECIES: helix-turn-helix transcriptional regulator [unclassified Clostridium]|uniref:helix-turn-helix transcriptional regulator n=1 Tax=unclassified Clostridium TaxID=2614128 RepID=UPI0016885E4C|nr:helix-turn-helix transcriptional regulator [Clostridium sp. HV4-5-A1G]
MKPNLLKAERVKAGLTQKDLSIALKKDVSTYSKKENGLVEFTASEIRALKQLLNLSPETIDKIFFDTKVVFKETIN